MNEKAWDKMGVAYCNVVEKDGKKTFIVRAATTVGTIWINTLINNHFKSFVMTEKKLKVIIATNIFLLILLNYNYTFIDPLPHHSKSQEDC